MERAVPSMIFELIEVVCVEVGQLLSAIWAPGLLIVPTLLRFARPSPSQSDRLLDENGGRRVLV